MTDLQGQMRATAPGGPSRQRRCSNPSITAKAPRASSIVGRQAAAVQKSAFETDLIRLIPNLRAFSRSLTDRNQSDDLVQDTLAKAWKSRATYRQGTNQKAWLFTIMRNQFVSGRRRAWRNVPLDPRDAENTLVVHENVRAREDLSELRDAMQRLPEIQRNLLLLAGPAGLTYAEIAAVCGCAIGTVKSRVSRARAAVAAAVKDGPRRTTSRGSPPSGVFDEMMIEAAHLRHQTGISMRQHS